MHRPEKEAVQERPARPVAFGDAARSAAVNPPHVTAIQLLCDQIPTFFEAKMAITTASVSSVSTAMRNAAKVYANQGTTVFTGPRMLPPGGPNLQDWWRQVFGEVSHTWPTQLSTIKDFCHTVSNYMQRSAPRVRAGFHPPNVAGALCSEPFLPGKSGVDKIGLNRGRYTWFNDSFPTCPAYISLKILPWNTPTVGSWWKNAHFVGWNTTPGGGVPTGTIDFDCEGIENGLVLQHRLDFWIRIDFNDWSWIGNGWEPLQRYVGAPAIWGAGP
jgi:hypothetical protein